MKHALIATGLPAKLAQVRAERYSTANSESDSNTQVGSLRKEVEELEQIIKGQENDILRVRTELTKLPSQKNCSLTYDKSRLADTQANKTTSFDFERQQIISALIMSGLPCHLAEHREDQCLRKEYETTKTWKTKPIFEQQTAEQDEEKTLASNGIKGKACTNTTMTTNNNPMEDMMGAFLNYQKQQIATAALVSLPTFHGSDQKDVFDEWIRRFESTIAMAKWDDATKISLLQSKLAVRPYFALKDSVHVIRKKEGSIPK